MTARTEEPELTPQEQEELHQALTHMQQAFDAFTAHVHSLQQQQQTVAKKIRRRTDTEKIEQIKKQLQQ